MNRILDAVLAQNSEGPGKLESFAPLPHRRGHDHDSFHRRLHTRLVTAPRSPSEVRQPTRPLRRKGSLHFSIVVLTPNGAKNFHSLRTGHRPPTHEHASARIIIRFPIPTPNTFLSKNRSMSATWTRRVLGPTTPIGVRRDDLLVAASGEERWAFTPGPTRPLGRSKRCTQQRAR